MISIVIFVISTAIIFVVDTKAYPNLFRLGYYGKRIAVPEETGPLPDPYDKDTVPIYLLKMGAPVDAMPQGAVDCEDANHCPNSYYEYLSVPGDQLAYQNEFKRKVDPPTDDPDNIKPTQGPRMDDIDAGETVRDPATAANKRGFYKPLFQQLRRNVFSNQSLSFKRYFYSK